MSVQLQSGKARGIGLGIVDMVVEEVAVDVGFRPIVVCVWDERGKNQLGPVLTGDVADCM